MFTVVMGGWMGQVRRMIIFSFVYEAFTMV